MCREETSGFRWYLVILAMVISRRIGNKFNDTHTKRKTQKMPAGLRNLFTFFPALALELHLQHMKQSDRFWRRICKIVHQQLKQLRKRKLLHPKASRQKSSCSCERQTGTSIVSSWLFWWYTADAVEFLHSWRLVDTFPLSSNLIANRYHGFS